MVRGTTWFSHQTDSHSFNLYNRQAGLNAFARRFQGQPQGKKDLKGLASVVNSLGKQEGELDLRALLSQLSKEERIALALREDLNHYGLKLLYQTNTYPDLQLIVAARLSTMPTESAVRSRYFRWLEAVDAEVAVHTIEILCTGTVRLDQGERGIIIRVAERLQKQPLYAGMATAVLIALGENREANLADLTSSTEGAEDPIAPFLLLKREAAPQDYNEALCRLANDNRSPAEQKKVEDEHCQIIDILFGPPAAHRIFIKEVDPGSATLEETEREKRMLLSAPHLVLKFWGREEFERRFLAATFAERQSIAALFLRFVETIPETTRRSFFREAHEVNLRNLLLLLGENLTEDPVSTAKLHYFSAAARLVPSSSLLQEEAETQNRAKQAANQETEAAIARIDLLMAAERLDTSSVEALLEEQIAIPEMADRAEELRGKLAGLRTRFDEVSGSLESIRLREEYIDLLLQNAALDLDSAEIVLGDTLALPNELAASPEARALGEKEAALREKIKAAREAVAEADRMREERSASLRVLLEADDLDMGEAEKLLGKSLEKPGEEVPLLEGALRAKVAATRSTINRTARISAALAAPVFDLAAAKGLGGNSRSSRENAAPKALRDLAEAEAKLEARIAKEERARAEAAQQREADAAAARARREEEQRKASEARTRELAETTARAWLGRARNLLAATTFSRGKAEELLRQKPAATEQTRREMEEAARRVQERIDTARAEAQKRKLGSLNEALAALEQTPHDAEVWDALLVFLKQNGNGSQPVHKGKKEKPPAKAEKRTDPNAEAESKKTIAFRRITLAAPSLTAEEAQKLKGRLTAKDLEKLGETYLKEADNEEDLAQTRELYASSVLLGNSGAENQQKGLELLTADIEILKRLLGAGNLAGFCGRLKELRAELPPTFFLLLQKKVGMTFERRLAAADNFEQAVASADAAELKGVLFSIVERRAEMDFLSALKARIAPFLESAKAKKRAAEEAAAKAAAKAAVIPLFKAAASAADPVFTPAEEFARVVEAKIFYAFSLDHPHAAAAGRIFHGISQPHALQETFPLVLLEAPPFCLAVAKRIIPSCRDNGSFVAQVALFSVAHKDPDFAIECMQDQLRTVPKASSVPVYHYLLFAYAAKGEWETIARVASGVLGNDKIRKPAVFIPDLHSALGIALQKTGREKEAWQELLTALQYEEPLTSYRVNMAKYRAFTVLGQLCLARLREKRATDADVDVDAVIQAGERYAERYADETLQVHALLADIYAQQERYAEAIVAGEKCMAKIKEERSLPSLRHRMALGLGNYYYLTGKEAESREMTVASLDHGYAHIAFMAGFESLFKNGSYGRAMEMLETAEAAFPQHRFLYRLYTASCLEQTGRQEEAAALYEELLAQQPENGHALFLRALQLQDQKQYAEALGHFDRIPVDSAHYQRGRINRIGTLYQMGQTERASTEGLAIWNEIGQDEKIDSEDKATLAFSLSRCFEKLGMKTEASQWAEETKRISPFYGLILDANEERGPALSLAQALTAEMEKDLHDSENWRSLLEFTKESADPQVVSHVRNWIEGVKGQLNFCLVYQAARQQEAAPLLLERLLPPTDKAALDKFEGSLEEGGMHSDAVALLRSAPSALQADPEVKVRLLWNLYLLKEWDTVTAQNLEALQRTLASASRSHQLLKVLRANILRAEGKTDEALRLYREVLAHQTVRKDPTNNDLELEVRMGIYHITFAGKRDDASVLGALRLMRPLMTRSQFEESAFTVMADIIEAAPPYLAKEIMVATRDHIELVRGTLPHALRVFMPRARKEDASPQLQDLANWLDETFNCEREIEG